MKITNVKNITIIILLTLCFSLAPIEFSQNRETGSVEVTIATVQAATQITAPTVSLKINDDNNVRISWKKVKNAAKYEVYRAVSGGKYTKVKTVTKLYYIDKTAKAGKTYSYKVKAVPGSSKYSKSKYSTVKKIKVPQKAEETKAEEKCVHEFGEWVISKPETFVMEGEKYRECKLCGAIEKETILPAGNIEFEEELSKLKTKYFTERTSLEEKIQECYKAVSNAITEKTLTQNKLTMLSPNPTEAWLNDYISLHLTESGSREAALERGVYTYQNEYLLKKNEYETAIKLCEISIETNNKLVKQYNTLLVSMTSEFSTNVGNLCKEYGIYVTVSSILDEFEKMKQA